MPDKELNVISEITEYGKQVYVDLASDESVVVINLREWLELEAKGVVEDENKKFTIAIQSATQQL